MFASLALIVITVPTEDKHAASHNQCGNPAHYEHRQTVHLAYAGDKPVHCCSGDEHLKDK